MHMLDYSLEQGGGSRMKLSGLGPVSCDHLSACPDVLSSRSILCSSRFLWRQRFLLLRRVKLWETELAHTWQWIMKERGCHWKHWHRWWVRNCLELWLAGQDWWCPPRSTKEDSSGPFCSSAAPLPLGWRCYRKEGGDHNLKGERTSQD